MQATSIAFVIRTTDEDSTKDVREFAARRLSFALRRFDHLVRRVTVRLEDLNGPRRGIDSRCVMTVELADGRQVVAEATTARPLASVGHAARRLNRAVGDHLQKRRTVRRRENVTAISNTRPDLSAPPE